ncbi:MAG: DNA helicase PcrA [Thermoanaerobacteraceae bacterium]|nr:DNA helicase PcrA [Thermoanaerobacteraceae bacterium]
MKDILSSLNEQQKEAVTTVDGPMLVIAGAGSGKTRVITHRIAYLVEEKGVDPANILAITFTNKAADEMKERLEQLLQYPVSGMWVSTFHSACVRILRMEADNLPYDRNFVIYDTTDQKSLIKSCIAELGLSDKKFDPRVVMSRISNAKNELLTPDKYRQRTADLYDEQIARIYALYQEKLYKYNAMDFDDLIMQTVLLFSRNPRVLSYYQNRFQYILVDEYQDTNHAQYVLVKLLAQAHENICVVGDPDQSIYGWRGADIQNILDFESDYPNARVIRLEQNYRSTKNILGAANEVIKNNLGRKPKNLWTRNDTGHPLVRYQAGDEQEEARFVAEEIFRLHREEGYKLGDCAILYRVHAQSRAFEDWLLKGNIPYEVVGGLRFYDRKEIKDLLAYLRVLANPFDNVSLGRIINEPKRGIGPATWERLVAMAEEQGVAIAQLLLSGQEIAGLGARAQNNVREFANLLAKLMEKKEQLPVTELVEAVLVETGYWDMLEQDKTPEGQARRENIREFTTVTQNYDRQHVEKDLEGFLAEISLQSDVDTYEGQDKVALMTLHTAKGLEFPVVFLVGMEEGIFPSYRSLPDPEQVEEERRLCYVGMTRAQERLYLTNAWRRHMYGSTQYNAQSRFLEEIPDEYFGITVKEQEKTPGSQKLGDTERGGHMFNLGDRVYHAKFGEGAIVKIEGEGSDAKVSVAFPDQGIKELMLAYAPLKKISK